MSVKPEKVSELFDFRRSARAVLDIEKQAIDGLYQYLTRRSSGVRDGAALWWQDSGDRHGQVGSYRQQDCRDPGQHGNARLLPAPGRGQPRGSRHDLSRDLIIAISNSGESDEILALLPVLKRRGIPLICMTGNPASTMAKEANVHLCIKVEKEACPLGLARHPALPPPW
jgi:arabinose-5-phosphate isomerase